MSFIPHPLPLSSPLSSFRPPIANLSLLRDVRIAVTAPAPYAARLCPILMRMEARPIWMPMITTTMLTDSKEISNLEAELLMLSEYDVLAFTSRTGMQAIGKRLQSLANGDAQLSAAMLKASGTKIAALGRDAAATMETLGVTVDIVPMESSPLGLVRHLMEDEAMKGARVLCPVPAVKGMTEAKVVPEFLEALRGAGFETVDIGAYETRPIGKGRVQREVEMLMSGEVDGVAISSCGEAHAMKEVLGEEGVEQFRKKVEIGEVAVGAHGPFTAEGVKEALGIEAIVSKDFSSFHGLVKVFEERLENRIGDRLLLPR